VEPVVDRVQCFGGRDGAGEHVVEGAFGLELEEVDDVGHRQIHLDDGDRLTRLSERDAEIDCRGGLADAAFRSGDREDTPVCHRMFSQGHQHKSTFVKITAENSVRTAPGYVGVSRSASISPTIGSGGSHSEYGPVPRATMVRQATKTGMLSLLGPAVDMATTITTDSAAAP